MKVFFMDKKPPCKRCRRMVYEMVMPRKGNEDSEEWSVSCTLDDDMFRTARVPSYCPRKSGEIRERQG